MDQVPRQEVFRSYIRIEDLIKSPPQTLPTELPPDRGTLAASRSCLLQCPYRRENARRTPPLAALSLRSPRSRRRYGLSRSRARARSRISWRLSLGRCRSSRSRARTIKSAFLPSTLYTPHLLIVFHYTLHQTLLRCSNSGTQQSYSHALWIDTHQVPRTVFLQSNSGRP